MPPEGADESVFKYDMYALGLSLMDMKIDRHIPDPLFSRMISDMDYDRRPTVLEAIKAIADPLVTPLDALVAKEAKEVEKIRKALVSEIAALNGKQATYEGRQKAFDARHRSVNLERDKQMLEEMIADIQTEIQSARDEKQMYGVLDWT
jgi:hypothetical protein